jgi:DNA-binding NarL/FixJ family response regulator
MTGYLLSDDLIFSSRITATGRAQNIAIGVCKTVDQLLTKVTSPMGVILDLNNPTLESATTIPKLRACGASRIVAYCSHVDTERILAAREAGCDLVLARSQFVSKLETHLAHWLDATSSATPSDPG